MRGVHLADWPEAGAEVGSVEGACPPQAKVTLSNRVGCARNACAGRAGTVAGHALPDRSLTLSLDRSAFSQRRSLAGQVVRIAGTLETSHCFREFIESGVQFVLTPGQFPIESLAPHAYHPIDG